jgi:hypothetical protein
VEVGCLFDEIQDLVEPTERRTMDSPAGPQRGRMPERRGRSRASDSPVPGECRTHEQPGQTKNTIREKKPFIVLDATQITVERAGTAVLRFIEENEIQILNVAGPRASGWPQGYAFALAVIDDVIAKVCKDE